jgi:Raf kinase inhibitor-like YbhB/YbcL family protein
MRGVQWILVVLASAAALVTCGPASPSSNRVTESPGAERVAPAEKAAGPTAFPALAITSSAFEPEGAIPMRHSCLGDNVSPPLSWSGVPGGTRALVLLVDDPDSRPPGFVHWVIYNIPPAATGLPEDVPGDTERADGSRQGSNGFAPYGPGTFPGGAAKKLVGYDGPCPPGGEHRYVFTLYALDAPLDLPARATVTEVQAAMEGHVLAQAALVGLFAPP